MGDFLTAFIIGMAAVVAAVVVWHAGSRLLFRRDRGLAELVVDIGLVLVVPALFVSYGLVFFSMHLFNSGLLVGTGSAVAAVILYQVISGRA